MVNLKIFLFRHGQSTYNRDKKFTGWYNPALTKKGIINAKNIAKQLKNKNFQVAFCTKLKRSKQTLKEVLKNHPECKEILEDNRIIERNYGSLNGKTHAEFIKKMGEKEYELIHRNYFVSPPKGESFARVEKRISSFINYLRTYMKKNKVNVAISAHGNSIRLFRKIMEKATIEKTIQWTIPYDKVYEYSIIA